MKECSFPVPSRKSAKIFFSALSCSQAMMTILDEALDMQDEIYEMSAHPLAGGLLHLGFQCGMTWGSSLSAGNYIYHKLGCSPASIGLAIETSAKLISSLSQQAGSHICKEITSCEFKSLFGRLKYLFTGKGSLCAKLAVKWAPQAYLIICSSTFNCLQENPKAPTACAVMLAKRLNASEREQLMVAGFSGGLGLSGGACGALATAVWLKTLKWLKEKGDSKDSFFKALRQELTQTGDFYPDIKNIQRQFESLTNGVYSCKHTTKREFSSVKEHCDFIANGGCKEILNLLEKAF